jgi:hypothetical protein
LSAVRDYQCWSDFKIEDELNLFEFNGLLNARCTLSQLPKGKYLFAIMDDYPPYSPLFLATNFQFSIKLPLILHYCHDIFNAIIPLNINMLTKYSSTDARV